MILVTLFSVLITFLIGFLFYTYLHSHPLKLGSKQIHHSLLGILLIIVGIYINRTFGVISAVGLGIYLGHVFEEIYLNKISPFKALLMFITKI